MKFTKRRLLAGTALIAVLITSPASAWLHPGASGGGATTITAVSLSNSTFIGGSASGTVVGVISVTMSSGLFSGSLSLSGANAASFQIVGNNLETNGIIANGTYNVNIVATQGGAGGSPFTQPKTLTGSSGALLTTLVVSNPGPGALAANSYVQFGHGYGPTDLASGVILQISDDLGSTIPYTAMRRSTGSGTSTRFSDNIARLPNGITAPLTITSITRVGTTATVTTSAPHGLSTGATVHMEGQAPDDYTGAYVITVTGASTFTYTMATTPATNATTAGVMNYTRVLTLNSVAGTWNNTLPNSKTAGNIVTDITTNFDNLTLTLSAMTGSSGSTYGSGTWVADLATALAVSTPNGLLRSPYSTTSQGQIVCDILAIQKFVDGATKHPTLSAWFFVTALLDQTTGAVVELRCRVWIDQSLGSAAMDYYTYKAELKLNTTVVRSTGLSSSNSIDGKVQNFAPSAVTTATGNINIPSHGFVGGETVRLTNSGGALPTGFSTGTDYAVIWVDGNNIKITQTFENNNQLGSSSAIAPSTQGSGTHTVTCWLHSATQNRIPYCRNDGLQDRWTGKTGAFSTQLTHCIHTVSYLQQTAKMIPPVDMSINLTNKVAVLPPVSGNTPPIDRFCYGAFGSLTYSQDDGGAGFHHEYGAPWTEVPLRRARYSNDRLGYCQTLRVDALMIGAWNVTLTNDDTTWRIPVFNNGSNHAGLAYSNMPNPAPSKYWFSFSVQSGFTAPTSTTRQNGVGNPYSMSHRYILLPRLLFFEGGMDIHDMFLQDANVRQREAAGGNGDTFPTSISSQKYPIGGTTYYTWIDGSEPRTDAWTLMVYADAAMHLADDAAEKPYLVDLFKDFLKIGNYLINTYAAANDPNFLTIGAWPYGETAKAGPGNTQTNNCDAFTGFFQSYLGMTFGHAYRMYQNSDFLGIITQQYKLVDNLYRVTAGNGWCGNSYSIRNKQASNTNANAGLTISAATLPMIEDQNLSHASGCVLYRTDGVLIGCNALPFDNNPPATGDQHYLTGTDAVGSLGTLPLQWVGPPSANNQLTYYVRQASGSYSGGWKYSTTNSDVNILTSFPAYFSTTLAAAVTTTGQTTIQTVDVPVFPNPVVNALSSIFSALVIGTEIVVPIGAYNYWYNVAAVGSITTTNLLPTVTFSYTAHGLSTGDKIRLYDTNGGTVLVGGLTLSGADQTVVAVDANTLTFTPGGNATSTDSLAVAAYWNANRMTVQRAKYGSTASTYSNGATVYQPYTSTIYTDLQNRVVAFPPTGHALRITTAAADVDDGYLTMARSSAGYGYMLGLIAQTAYDNATLWFNDATVPSGAGPNGFATKNMIRDSINIAL